MSGKRSKVPRTQDVALQRQQLTRRDLLILAGASGAGILLAGCGSGNLFTGSQGSQASRAAGKVTISPNARGLANENGQQITYLGGNTGDNQVITLYYGTRGADGLAARILQSLTFSDDITQAARAVYNEQGLPILVRHEANSAFLTLAWEPTRAVLKLYQPDGSFIGGATVSAASSRASAGQAATVDDFVIVPLPTTTPIGTYVGTLTGLTDAVVTLTIGANSQGARSVYGVGPKPFDTNALHNRAASRAAAAPSATDLVPALAALQKAAQATTALPFANTLLSALAVSAAGTNDLLPAILTRALGGIAPSPPFVGSGAPLAPALAAPLSLASSIGALLTRIQAQENPIATNDLFVGDESPLADGYQSPVTFVTPGAQGDNTRIVGVVSAREFGSASLAGTIDGTNTLTIVGTAKDGTAIALTGTVQNGKIPNGHWTTTPGAATSRAGGGSGDWSADQKPLGQCMEQQNSGNQGIFTNTYDIGRTCGTLPFSYDAFFIPDQFQIFYEGDILVDTGSVSGGQALSLRYTGSTSLVTVVVTAALEGTAWTYTVGCP